MKKIGEWEFGLSHPRFRSGYMWMRFNAKHYDKDYKLTLDKQGDTEFRK